MIIEVECLANTVPDRKLNAETAAASSGLIMIAVPQVIMLEVERYVAEIACYSHSDRATERHTRENE
jgi:hypothetical protein